MNNPPIPILAYTFIGITSLVLAYATFLDKSANESNNNKTATSMLPDVFSKTPIPSIATNNPNQPVTNVIPTAPNNNLEQKPTVGGKTKRHKKKSRNTKRKNNTK
jgi:hypothetical protein